MKKRYEHSIVSRVATGDRRGQESHLRPPACLTGALLLSYPPMGYLIGIDLGKLDLANGFGESEMGFERRFHT
jgi:hypothetical protein